MDIQFEEREEDKVRKAYNELFFSPCGVELIDK
jgi:hypothetical protein